MSKELEAINEYIEIYAKLKNDEVKYDEVIDKMHELYDCILKTLTPPTDDEVCESLSEYFGFNFYYQDNFFYRSDGIKYIYPLKVSGFTEIQLYDGHLPPHLITLIGRFYEGEIK